MQAQQPVSNIRVRHIDARKSLHLLDTLTILPPILHLTDSTSGEPLDAGFFTLENNYIRIDTDSLQQAHPGVSVLVVAYRVLPVNLAAPVSRLDSSVVQRKLGEDAIEFDYTPYNPASNPWETSGLVSSGTYTRGLSFGNNQNLAFNSNLNLQLNGRLGNDLELSAALSDNSIPLQPDGTTRQLREFDRVYVQLRRKQASLTAGDFDLTRPGSGSYFVNYFKRLQGGMLEVSGSHGTDTAAPGYRIRTAAAVSRGKFARQQIAGQEGNQGPYRLQGSEGERFIIVIAGTEKVYIDGQLMIRGLDDDYVIDYNLGEVTFTPKRLVSKDSRIIVEFEYAVQAYLRSTVATDLEYRLPKSRFYFNAYAEQDGKNTGGAQELSPADRQQLALAGDDLSLAVTSGIDTLAAGEVYDPGRVLYQSRDTVACGVPVTILVYTSDAENARYAARFTEVPMGQGNYRQIQNAANGRVFEWVAPDPVTCQPGGNFEPVIRLIAPESRQLFAAGTELQVGKKGAIQAELALSNRDLNRFSPLGNEDNQGIGGFFRINQSLLSGAATKGWILHLDGKYEFAGRQFQALNPYRPAEFVRDWNIPATDSMATEHWVRSGFQLVRKEWGTARYEFGAFFRQDAYDGNRHFAQFRLAHAGFDLLAEANLLNSKGLVERTRFSRPKVELGKTFYTSNKKALFKLGVYGERERNERRAMQADTLQEASFWYDLSRVYWKLPDSQRVWQWGFSWMHRNDFVPQGRAFKQNTAVDEWSATGSWNPKPGMDGSYTQALRWNLSWRDLRILDPELTDQEARQTYLGRIDYQLSAWKNALAFTTGYELGAGQSPRLEFSYIRVNPGEGQYAWIDRNQDSILQVDEMEIAIFQDQASYVRIAVTTPDYVRTNNVVLNQSLRLTPRLIWAQSKKRWQKFLGRLSTQSNLQINRRVLAAARGEPAWNPFDLSVVDTALVAVTAVTRHVLYVNRADPVWDVSLAFSDNSSRTALTTGFESRRLQDQTLHGRVNFSTAWSGEGDVSQGKRINDSEVFNSRDYTIRYWKILPKLTWLPGRTFRLTAAYTWLDSRNTLPSAETARQQDLSAEVTWNPAGKPNSSGFRPVTSMRSKLTYARIDYSGTANSAVAYAMLDGLQDGRNFLWTLTLDRQLSRAVQLSLNYEGRKTGDSRIVHVGRAQVRAIF